MAAKDILHTFVFETAPSLGSRLLGLMKSSSSQDSYCLDSARFTPGVCNHFRCFQAPSDQVTIYYYLQMN